jgi:hypothetical protein
MRVDKLSSRTFGPTFRPHAHRAEKIPHQRDKSATNRWLPHVGDQLIHLVVIHHRHPYHGTPVLPARQTRRPDPPDPGKSQINYLCSWFTGSAAIGINHPAPPGETTGGPATTASRSPRPALNVSVTRMSRRCRSNRRSGSTLRLCPDKRRAAGRRHGSGGPLGGRFRARPGTASPTSATAFAGCCTPAPPAERRPPRTADRPV